MTQPNSARQVVHFSVSSLLAVGLGGFVGAGLRIVLALLLPDAPGFPLTTLGINVLGTAGLGTCSVYWAATARTPAWLRAGIGTGFFGAFTTFSTVVLFMLGTSWSTALLYAVVSLGLSAVAAWGSMRGTEALLRRSSGDRS